MDLNLIEGICCAYCCGDCGWAEPEDDGSGKFDGHEVINITINMKAQMDVVDVLQRNN